MACHKRYVKLFIDRKSFFIPKELTYQVYGYNKACSQNIPFIRVMLRVEIVKSLFKIEVKLWDEILGYILI